MKISVRQLNWKDKDSIVHHHVAILQQSWLKYLYPSLSSLSLSLTHTHTHTHSHTCTQWQERERERDWPLFLLSHFLEVPACSTWYVQVPMTAMPAKGSLCLSASVIWLQANKFILSGLLLITSLLSIIITVIKTPGGHVHWRKRTHLKVETECREVKETTTRHWTVINTLIKIQIIELMHYHLVPITA